MFRGGVRMQPIENSRRISLAKSNTESRPGDSVASGMQAGQHRTPLGRRLVESINWRMRRYVVGLVERYVAKAGAEQFHCLDNARRLRAALESVDYADMRMQGALICSKRRAVLDYGLGMAAKPGLFMEFGVWSGRSINHIASRHPGVVHGFDSFEGLPENWSMDFLKGDFDTRGRLPNVRSNVRLHVGWFDRTLPEFIAENDDSVAFLHVDCDLYSSTKTIFQFLGDRIGPGTVIVFDEYFNYPGWQMHEFKAFQEFIAERSLHYRYLCFNKNECNVATIIA